MSVPSDKQGHVGDLREKSLPELKELLDRQESLLKKGKFLNTLPDKGTKVQKFAETLRQLIAEREDVNATTNRLKSVTIVERKKKEVSSFEKLRDKDDSVNDGTVPKEFCAKGDNSDSIDVSDRLSEYLERVTLSGHPHSEGDGEFINSYERVIRRADEQYVKKQHFKPNSTLKISSVQELPDKFKLKSKNVQHEEPGQSPLKAKSSSSETENVDKVCMDSGASVVSRRSDVQEESAVCIPSYKHDKSLLISVEESVKLVETQRKKHEELQARQAAERLAGRLHIRLDNYNPEGTNMAYRVHDSDPDSDDEPEMSGYPEDYEG